jgi:hypothetical protein
LKVQTFIGWICAFSCKQTRACLDLKIHVCTLFFLKKNKQYITHLKNYFIFIHVVSFIRSKQCVVCYYLSNNWRWLEWLENQDLRFWTYKTFILIIFHFKTRQIKTWTFVALFLTTKHFLIDPNPQNQIK